MAEDTDKKKSSKEKIDFSKLELEELAGGKAGVLGTGENRQLIVQPEGDKYYYNYTINSDAKGKGVWLKGNQKSKAFKPVSNFWMSDKKRSLLTSLHLQKAAIAGMQSTLETEEVAKYEIQKCGGWGAAAKACGIVITVSAAGAAGAQLMKMYGPEKTITNNVPGNDIHHWNNNTVGDHFNVLLKEVKEQAKDVWTPAQIDQKWGKNTTDNVSALENILAKDGVADTLWDNAVYQAALNALGLTKEKLYDKTFGELAQLVNDIGVKDGIKYVHSQALAKAKEVTQDIANLTKPYEGATPSNISALDELIAKDNIIESLVKLDSSLVKETLYAKSFSDLAQIAYDLGGDAAKQPMINAHLAAMAKAKAAVGDVFSDKELSDNYSGVTIKNITALENLATIDPQIDSTFADSYIADYFSHTGLTKKAAYTDKDLQGKVQAGIEYKFTAIDFENDRTASKLLNESGNAREASLKALKDAAAYSWLTSNYNKNITEDLTDKIALNSTLKNSTVGKAMFDLSNFDADKIMVYQTADGAFIQGYKAGLPVAKAGAEGGYKISAAEYTILKNL